MFTVLECVTQQHQSSIVLVAAAIALTGMFAFFHLMLRAEESAAERRRNWALIAAFAGGLSVWATHFVAMLAYEGTVTIGFDWLFTALSSALAVAGFRLALAIGLSRPRLLLGAAGLITMSVAVMHFVGMAGVRAAAQVRFDWLSIAVGAVVAFVMFAGALAAFMRLAGWRRILVPGSVAVIGICTLHFTTMSATILAPDPALPAVETGVFDRIWLTSAISAVTFLVLLVLAIAVVVDRYLVDLKGFANATLDGLALVQDGRIVEINTKFAQLCERREGDIVGLPPNLLLKANDGQPVDAARQRPVEATPQIGERHRIFELAVHTIDYGGRPCQVIAIRDLTEKRAAQRKVEYLARHDMLTGLTNRSMFQEALEEALTLSRETGEAFALLSLDLDRFKAVNDLFGHAEGDRVLRDVAEILRSAICEGDVVARLGGDEFIILARRVGGADAYGALAERILAIFRERMDLLADPTAVGVSIGIALSPKDGKDAETLMHSADVALYRAKNSGRGVHAFYDRTMDHEARERRQLENDLRQAIAREEFHLLFQPIQSIADETVVGYEALLRWDHPVRGNVSPDLFIPIAEESGIILSIGEWVLREACRQAAGWREPCKVAVNISAVQFRLPGLAFLVCTVLNETGLAPARLELEVTESALLKDRRATIETLRQLKAIGVQIVMDDFGTGYSSLSNLQAFPFDRLKIDRSFIASMQSDPNARAIVQAVVGLGRSLNLPVTAEGIETEEQYRMIVEEGCRHAQGFLLGRPGRGPLPLAPVADLPEPGVEDDTLARLLSSV